MSLYDYLLLQVYVNEDSDDEEALKLEPRKFSLPESSAPAPEAPGAPQNLSSKPQRWLQNLRKRNPECRLLSPGSAYPGFVPGLNTCHVLLLV